MLCVWNISVGHTFFPIQFDAIIEVDVIANGHTAFDAVQFEGRRPSYTIRQCRTHFRF